MVGQYYLKHLIYLKIKVLKDHTHFFLNTLNLFLFKEWEIGLSINPLLLLKIPGPLKQRSNVDLPAPLLSNDPKNISLFNLKKKYL